MKLSELKGFGPKRLALLEQMGINSCEALTRFFPQEYLDYDRIDEIVNAQEGDTVTLQVKILADPTLAYVKGSSIVSARAADPSGKLTLRWMNQPYRRTQIAVGEKYVIHGRVSKKHGTVVYNPQINKEASGIVPIYHLPKGLTQSVFRAAVAEALTSVVPDERLPIDWRERFGLMPMIEALHTVHFPKDMQSLQRAKYRLQFESTLYYFLAVYAFRERVKLQNGYAFKTEGLLDRYLHKLPFTPTAAQLRVMREVEADLGSHTAMNRLVQGDVGSGKTVIAEYALAVAAANGKQGVLLAPTEILALQHYRTLQKLFGCTVVLYIGSLSQKARREVLARIENGEALVAVGTHALLSDSVRFHDLGVVVTDEQHRFGVGQRAKMEVKGTRPDVLVMSATPIPRTLALMLYADLSLSIIDEMPKGRMPVKTVFIPKTKREAMYRYIGKQIVMNQRAYVVCPLIEETEGYEGLSVSELHDELQRLLPDCQIGLLHGRMKEEEKNAVMEAFRIGELPILVSTTVIEVGVDVKEATFMVIEGADHFGLATLHQLRGRVGRNDLQSYCYLLCNKPTQNARDRIQAMISSNDGFYLAQQDMEMRGYGDLFGVRQSGDGEIGGLLRSCSTELLEKASRAAKEIMQMPSLENNELLETAVKQYELSNIARN